MFKAKCQYINVYMYRVGCYRVMMITDIVAYKDHCSERI